MNPGLCYLWPASSPFPLTDQKELEAFLTQYPAGRVAGWQYAQAAKSVQAYAFRKTTSTSIVTLDFDIVCKKVNEHDGGRGYGGADEPLDVSRFTD